MTCLSVSVAAVRGYAQYRPPSLPSSSLFLQICALDRTLSFHHRPYHRTAKSLSPPSAVAGQISAPAWMVHHRLPTAILSSACSLLRPGWIPRSFAQIPKPGRSSSFASYSCSCSCCCAFSSSWPQLTCHDPVAMSHLPLVTVDLEFLERGYHPLAAYLLLGSDSPGQRAGCEFTDCSASLRRPWKLSSYLDNAGHPRRRTCCRYSRTLADYGPRSPSASTSSNSCCSDCSMVLCSRLGTASDSAASPS